ncbi:MAG: hypothetical protein IPL23_27325 [Saprospiraceae bacterium]|nr:hypothetical protein [Saprospiraceae bacterium]MBK8635134.1 hypothetical protein [Saprospiraceae bacterium]MBP7642952.1 hypothetical protein [Saprospiraceae bacterium]HMS66525.1 hypothetical protein [Saprospiraceae bacterium]
MKIFTFILSIYILVLSIVPCTDGIGYYIDYELPQQPMDQQSHDHSNQNQDHCSPFCICACCSSLVIIPLTHEMAQIKFDLSASYLHHYTFDYTFDYNKGVWHPPSIG